MKAKLDKARQAFKEKYGVMPEDEGFVAVKKLGNKLVFAKSLRALDAFRQGERIKKKCIISLFLSSLLTILIWWGYLFWVNPANIKLGFVIIFFGWALLTLQIHSKKETQYITLRESWQDQVIIYDIYEGEIVKP